MKQAILQYFVRPLSARLGTIAATYLLAAGVPSGEVNEVIASGSAFLLVLLDLVVASYYRKLTIKEAD